MSKNLDLRSKYKQNTLAGTEASDRRKENVSKLRDRRAKAFASNRKIPQQSPNVSETENIKPKKLPWGERYKIWKKEKDEQRKIEQEKKMKSRPAFKPAGVASTRTINPLRPINKTSVNAKATLSSNARKPIEAEKTIKCKDTALLSTVNRKSAAPADKMKTKLNMNAFKAGCNSNKMNKTSNPLPKINTTIKSKLDNRNVSSLTKASNNTAPNKARLSKNISPKISQNKLNALQTKTKSRLNENDICSHKAKVRTSLIKLETPQKNIEQHSTPTRIRIVNEHNSSLLITPSNRVLRSRRKLNCDNGNQNSSQLKAETVEIAEIEPVESKTPENKREEAPVYVSPFVTVSRGKQSMKNEKLRRSSVLPYAENDSPDHRSAQAKYYRDVVKNETSRLMKIHDSWHQYKTENESNLTEEACDHIDVALGQTKLLTTNKFEQFRELINDFSNDANGKDGQKILASDLNAFWDMIFIQVNNINKRFDRLEKLKNNNWEHVLTPREIKTKVIKKKELPVKKLPQTSSKLRDHIKAARKKLPAKKSPQVRPANKSMLSKVLKANTERLNTSASYLNQSASAGKGILKNSAHNKSLNSSKSVLFRRSDCNEIIDFDSTLPTENIRPLHNSSKKIRPSIDLISWDSPEGGEMISNTSTPNQPSRRLTKRGILT